jgi:hypothetical protein
VRRLICIFVFIALFFTACSTENNMESNSQSENNPVSEAISSINSSSASEEVSSTLLDDSNSVDTEDKAENIRIKGKAESPDGNFILYDIDRNDPDWMSRGTVKLYDVKNDLYTVLFDYVAYVEYMEFLTESVFRVQTGRQYVIGNVNGETLFDISDYMTLGEAADGTENMLLRSCFINNKIIFTYLDRNFVTDDYKVAVFDGEFRVINTGKTVEGDSLYVSPAIEIIDENTILLYAFDRAENRTFEVTVSLSTGQSTIKDYRN